MNENLCSSKHILIGLGGTGGKILRAFKMRMFEEFPDAETRDSQSVALLYVDSTDDLMPWDGRPRPDFRVNGMDASFTNREFLYIKSVDLSNILDNIDRYPAIKSIVQDVNAVRSAIGTNTIATGQKRFLGRLLFAANAKSYVNYLRDAVSRCIGILNDPSKITIHIFAGLGGGTGSGSIIDAIVQARKTFPQAVINVFAMLPEKLLTRPDMDQGRYYPNAYAAINELNALQTGTWFPQDVTGCGEANFYNERIKGVADTITLYSNTDENGVTVNSLSELPEIVSDYVFNRVFYIKEHDYNNEHFLRAFHFEGMDIFANEYDETANPDPQTGAIPVARTKKLHTFGIKRVVYPEPRVLRHTVYTVGKSVLLQFMYNNWSDSQGFTNEECHRDIYAEFFNKENLQKWMLDLAHLTLEKKVLPNDSEHESFADFWRKRAAHFASAAQKSKFPLNELDKIMNEHFENLFRETGVTNYYAEKEHIIPQIAHDIRTRVEEELFKKWEAGTLSISELKEISGLILNSLSKLRQELEELIKQEELRYEECDASRQEKVKKWIRLNILQHMMGMDKRCFTAYHQIQTEYYTSKTKLVAFHFATKLIQHVGSKFIDLDNAISDFSMKISEAIDETECLIHAQEKVGKGLEDISRVYIDVRNEDTISKFEADIRSNKFEMADIVRQIRESILPHECLSFKRLSLEIYVSDIINAFNSKLENTVRSLHDLYVESDKEVLGLNILTRLQQELPSDDAIRSFAVNIVRQSGVLLNLSQEQVQLHLRNNEGNLSPTNPASIDRKCILVSIPSPDDNPGLKRFANKLEDAFKSVFKPRHEVTVNRRSPQKNELTIIALEYCFPMRCIDSLQDLHRRYEQFLHTGDPDTDRINAILLHGGTNNNPFPPLFAKA